MNWSFQLLNSGAGAWPESTILCLDETYYNNFGLSPFQIKVGSLNPGQKMKISGKPLDGPKETGDYKFSLSLKSSE